MRTLRNIAISNDKKNKTRSILIIIAITLTTMLLTIISSYCYGIMKNNKINAKDYYGDYYGVYKNISEKQIHEMKLRSEFTAIGRMAYAGEVDSETDSYLYWTDQTVAEMTNLNKQIAAGKKPEKTNEIMGTKDFFHSLGVQNPQIGETVTLKSRISNQVKFHENKFVISGFMKENETSSTKKEYVGYVSEQFYNSQVEKNFRTYNTYFKLGKNTGINYDNAETIIEDLAEKCGIDSKAVVVNFAYLLWATDPGTEIIVVGAILILFVILFSIVVIYNIFQVGITQKIQEYGKIKAMGATKKQLKKIVMLEGMLLSVIGVPLGMLSGCVIGKMVFSWFMNQSNSINTNLNNIEINILSIPILIGVMLIAFLTVRLALNRPMRMVIKISPVEAMRFQDGQNVTQGLRKGRKKVGVREMTMASIYSNKKRTAATIMTMGLSCVLFVALASLVSNMDAEYETRRNIEYGQFYLDLDYSLNDKAYPENNLDEVLKNNPLGKNTIEQIKDIPGVTDVKTRKILVMKELDEKGKATKGLASVLVFDKESFNRVKERDNNIGNLDYEKASKENSLIFGWSYFMEEDGYSVGQKMNAMFENTDSSCRYSGSIQGSFETTNANWVITEDTYEKLGLTDEGIGEIWIDCKEKDKENVKAELETLLQTKDHIEMKTYDETLKEIKFSMRMSKLICYSLITILGLIGFMNMANTMIISIITRKQEFGMLQAIGMTNNQLNRMLQMEGLVFTVGTVLAAMILGIPMGYALFHVAKQKGTIGLHQYHFPWQEMLFMIVVVGLLQMILSFILSRNVRKESLVDRIRY